MFRVSVSTACLLAALLAAPTVTALTLDLDGLAPAWVMDHADRDCGPSDAWTPGAPVREAIDCREGSEEPEESGSGSGGDVNAGGNDEIEKERRAHYDEARFQLADVLSVADLDEEAVDAAMSLATARINALQKDVEGHADQVQNGLMAVLDPQEEPEAPADAYQTQATATQSGRDLPTMMVLAAVGTTAASMALLWIAGSGGIAGATSATGAAGAASSEAGRKAPLVLSPLFTRFEKDTVMKHPNRAQLYNLVAASPGIRLQDLCDETSLSRTAVTHHLRLLEQQHVIVSKRVGRSRHYYENGGRFEREQKAAYALLQNERSRLIADYIRDHPGTIQKQLCEALDLRASIAHWHVKRLEEAALIDAVRQGRTVSYFPADAMRSVNF